MAAAALKRHYPATHARLFRNLSRTEGPAVVMTVSAFLHRLDAMANGEGVYGAEGPRAAKLLARRGLSSGVIGQARDLLAKLATLEEPAVPFSVEQQQAEQARAEKALWDWYLEWSRVARLVIKQRALLRQLGFLGNRTGADADAEAKGESETNEPAPEPGATSPEVPASSLEAEHTPSSKREAT